MLKVLASSFLNWRHSSSVSYMNNHKNFVVLNMCHPPARMLTTKISYFVSSTRRNMNRKFYLHKKFIYVGVSIIYTKKSLTLVLVNVVVVCFCCRTYRLGLSDIHLICEWPQTFRSSTFFSLISKRYFFRLSSAEYVQKIVVVDHVL